MLWFVQAEDCKTLKSDIAGAGVSLAVRGFVQSHVICFLGVMCVCVFVCVCVCVCLCVCVCVACVRVR